MEIEIGSNVFKNSNGIIQIEGVPQIEVTLQEPEGPLLVNFVAFDSTGRIIAKVVNSSLSFNELATYSVSRSSTGMLMTKREAETVALQVELKEPGKVVISKGEFFTAKGHPFEISPVEWKTGEKRSSWAETDVQEGFISIG